MAYKYGVGLEFLRQMSSEDLNELVEVLKGKDNDKRFSENLSYNERFRMHYPKHSEYIELILEELQRYGGNTFANFVRNGGVLYAEILKDVCKKMKVSYSSHYPVEDIESALLFKIARNALENMNDGECKDLFKTLDVKTDNYTPQAVVMALQAAIKLGKFKSYQLTLSIVNTIWKAVFGRGANVICKQHSHKMDVCFCRPCRLDDFWNLGGCGYGRPGIQSYDTCRGANSLPKAKIYG
ncbi:MAG: DUF3944 domain-containing protein [Helicobacteraceae bacterium]